MMFSIRRYNIQEYKSAYSDRKTGIRGGDEDWEDDC